MSYFFKLGIIPGDGGTWILPRIIGEARAAELFYTGDVIDAHTALEWGLVSRVTPPDSLIDQAQKIAEDSSNASTFPEACQKSHEAGAGY